eukprot:6202496-Pleurochrysis_carterae.AAC.4
MAFRLAHRFADQGAYALSDYEEVNAPWHQPAVTHVLWEIALQQRDGPSSSTAVLYCHVARRCCECRGARMRSARPDRMRSATGLIAAHLSRYLLNKVASRHLAADDDVPDRTPSLPRSRGRAAALRPTRIHI